ncbi:hypothetical protein AB0L20_31835, partial [Streptomyces albidoflavus]|uniref:hypothetical protein n=1 Tax=Streptomyces albidoflavus TaxID=1886 RepID=UPI0034160BC0
VVLVIGGLAANALSNLVRGSTTQAGLGNPDLLATVANVMVWAFAIVIAVNQIGVAETLVNTLFMAVVGAVAIALGLAFGLGGKDTAAKIVEDWYSKSHGTSKKIERAVETGTHITQARSGRRHQANLRIARSAYDGEPPRTSSRTGKAGPPREGMVTGCSSHPMTCAPSRGTASTSIRSDDQPNPARK